LNEIKAREDEPTGRMLGRFLSRRLLQILAFAWWKSARRIAILLATSSKRRSLSDDVYQNTDDNRFELDINGAVAAAYYDLAPGVITFTHTEVPAELNGRGIGSKLIKGALDAVRAQGLKVVAKCPFVHAYIEKHPEYADLLI
jgi:predicted GNAT family acetyltransferase